MLLLSLIFYIFELDKYINKKFIKILFVESF